MDQVTYVVGGPWYGSRVDARLLATIAGLCRVGGVVGAQVVDLRYQDGCLVDLVRSRLLAEQLDNPADADWFVSFDSDVSARHLEGFAAALAESLRWFNARDVALVAAPVRTVSGIWNVREEGVSGRDWRRERTPRDVERIGFGMVAFRLAWYREKWPQGLPYFRAVVEVRPGAPHGYAAVGEDYWHCDRVRELGGRVICDPRLEVRHHVARPGSQGERLE